MNFDIRDVPFSRYGSYFVFSKDRESGELLLRDVHGGDESPSVIFKLEVIRDGHGVPYDIIAEETKLCLREAENPDCMVNICISDEDTIHIEGKGLGFRLRAVKSRYDSIMKYDNDKWEYHLYSKEIKMMLSLIVGKIKMDADWGTVGNNRITIDTEPTDGYMHIVLEGYKTVWGKKSYGIYDDAQKRVEDCYKKWVHTMPKVPEKYKKSGELASYITWSCVVHPEGRLTRYSMYMSKNWMYNIWSWDNCFNAMLLCTKNPELALNQLLVFIDNQDTSGVYPDFINDRYSSFNCVKPPIHAWAFKRLREKNDYFSNRDIVETVYYSLSKATDYWIKYRVKKPDTLPVYNHGNDSGWDNASVFHLGIPVESPDLAAHLIRQMDILSEISSELGRENEAEVWKLRADEMYKLLIKRLWNGEQFTAIYYPDDKEIPNKLSLLLRMPIVIGYRMTDDIKSKLIESLEKDFKCRYGLSTEATRSDLYKENGYWLGPVWAPVMYLIIDALNECGYSDMAKDYSEHFCNATLVGGMAENFDPFTGKGLVDPAFTWTSSVFLMLASEYLKL